MLSWFGSWAKLTSWFNIQKNFPPPPPKKKQKNMDAFLQKMGTSQMGGLF